MTDSVLILDGRAHQIWRRTAKEDLPPMHPDVVEKIMEVADNVAGEGDLWDGKEFKPRPGATEVPHSKSDDIALRDALIAKGLIAQSDIDAEKSRVSALRSTA